MDIQKLFNVHNSVLVCPLEEGREVIHSHNADKAFKTASVMKTFVLAYYLHTGADMDRVITLPKKNLIGTSIMTELRINTATVKELLIYMMSFSDNSATNALLEDATFEAINDFCVNVLGTKQTVIGRKMLDFAAVERGEDNLTCLEDCLKAMRLVISYPEGRDIMSRHKCTDRIMRYVFTNDIEYYGKAGGIPFVVNDIGVLRLPGGEYMFAGVLTYKDNGDRARKLCGMAGLAALGLERPIV